MEFLQGMNEVTHMSESQEKNTFYMWIAFSDSLQWCILLAEVLP